MRFAPNGCGNPNTYYEPNSFGGAVQTSQYREPPLPLSGEADRYDHRLDNDDYLQVAGNLFRLMSADGRERLTNNIAEAMQGVPLEIVKRQVTHFYRADPEYGMGVAKRMSLGDFPAMRAAE
jgi:catalase